MAVNEKWDNNNLIYILSLDNNFAPFLLNTSTWLKKSTTSPTRGLQNDPDSVAKDQRKTAQQKVVQLELMLGQIVNYCPIIARNTIVKNSVSLADVWQKIRQHYGFRA